VPADARPRVEMADRLRIALYEGDFDEASRRATELDAMLETRRYVFEHGLPARAAVHAAREKGDEASAVRVAASFLQRRRAWAPVPVLTDFEVALDPTIAMLETTFHAGSMSSATFETERANW